jgi:hypothetical protein
MNQKECTFMRCRQQRRKIVSVVGNNADYLSELWSSTLKNFRRFRQQRRTVNATRINILKN